jgi:hypothetical protein
MSFRSEELNLLLGRNRLRSKPRFNLVPCKYCGDASVKRQDLCKRHLELKWKWQEGHSSNYTGQEWNGSYWIKPKNRCYE